MLLPFARAHALPPSRHRPTRLPPQGTPAVPTSGPHTGYGPEPPPRQPRSPPLTTPGSPPSMAPPLGSSQPTQPQLASCGFKDGQHLVSGTQGQATTRGTLLVEHACGHTQAEATHHPPKKGEHARTLRIKFWPRHKPNLNPRVSQRHRGEGSRRGHTQAKNRCLSPVNYPPT